MSVAKVLFIKSLKKNSTYIDLSIVFLVSVLFISTLIFVIYTDFLLGS